MNENQKEKEDRPNEDINIPRESLLDDQFVETSLNKFLLYNDEDHDKTHKSTLQQEVKKKKPQIDKNLIYSSSTEKYRNFLSKIKKSNEDIKNMDAGNVIIDKDIFDATHDNDKACVFMDVSVGIFDVCNKNINESKLKEMNITISDVADQ
ncbi:conserved protein, unknown function, partial [Hepatocystis sp. ex Piliocolobus tephrosceles]